MNKANFSQGSELQCQAEKLTAEREKNYGLQKRLDQFTADHTATLAEKATLQAELKTVLAEIDHLNNALVVATEK